jgi:hypothetical protein
MTSKKKLWHCTNKLGDFQTCNRHADPGSTKHNSWLHTPRSKIDLLVLGFLLLLLFPITFPPHISFCFVLDKTQNQMGASNVKTNNGHKITDTNKIAEIGKLLAVFTIN